MSIERPTEIPLSILRRQLSDYRDRFDEALTCIEALPDVMEVDADIAIAMRKAITALESFTKLTPAEHVERLAKACAADMAELTDHRTTVTNAQRNLTRTFQPGEVEAKQRIEQQRDDAELRIPILEKRISRMQDVLQVLNPIPESSNEK